MSVEPARVDERAAGTRLDVWLSGVLRKGRTEVQRLIADGRVTVDGVLVPKSQRLEAGQIVAFELPVEPVSFEAPPPVPIRYQDDHLAVVAKPAGLVVHAATGTRGPTLVDVLAPQMALAQAAGDLRPGIVHRLDKGTSGLMVVAKTDAAYEELSRQMKQRQVRRTYRALAHGNLALPRGRIEAPIGRQPRHPTAMSVRAGGRPSTTEFEVLESLRDASYLEVELLTGRTHQIRVHLAHIDHPVVGDLVYGGGAEHLSRELELDRPFLHAAMLRFAHPMTGLELAVEEPLPPDLERALEIARART